MKKKIKKKKRTIIRRVVYFWEYRIYRKKILTSVISRVKGLNKSSANIIKTILGWPRSMKAYRVNYNILFFANKFFKKWFIVNRQLVNYKIEVLSNLNKFSPLQYRRRLVRLPVRGQRTHSNAKTAKKLLNIRYVHKSIKLKKYKHYYGKK